MTHPKHILLGLMVLVALQACQASTDTESKKSGKAAVKTEDASGTSTDQNKTTPIESESVSVPSIVSGALLVCFNENSSEKTTLVSCGAVDKSEGTKLDLDTKFKEPKFSANNTTGLTVVKEALPVISKWHVRFRLTGASASDLSNALKKVSFSFEAQNLSGVVVSQLEKTIVEYPKKLSSRIRNLKTWSDGNAMCMNSHYEAGYPDIVTLEVCNGTASQDWALNSNKMIQWGMGACLNIDKVQILHPRGCALPEAAEWVKNGEEIRLNGTNTCLAMSDKYLLFGNVFPMDCNASDPMQHWVIEAF